MRNVIRSGLAVGVAGALALAGAALAQHGSPSSDTKASTGGGESAGSDKTMTGAPSAGAKLDKGLQSKLETLHADNQGEIQMAQLAAQNAQSPSVKQFAEKVASDHERLDKKLQTTAQSAGATLDGKDFQKAQAANQKELTALQSKTGKDFDKAYMSRAVKDHESDLKTVKAAQQTAEKTKQPELAALLAGAQKGMQGHLEHAKAVEKSLSHPTSGGTGSSGGAVESPKQPKPGDYGK
jgi:putative membrane protein